MAGAPGPPEGKRRRPSPAGGACLRGTAGRLVPLGPSCGRPAGSRAPTPKRTPPPKRIALAEAHKRSGVQYLDRQEFLKRTELREYELERDKRLASDVRTRGRL